MLWSYDLPTVDSYFVLDCDEADYRPSDDWWGRRLCVCVRACVRADHRVLAGHCALLKCCTPPGCRYDGDDDDDGRSGGGDDDDDGRGGGGRHGRGRGGHHHHGSGGDDEDATGSDGGGSAGLAHARKLSRTSGGAGQIPLGPVRLRRLTHEQARRAAAADAAAVKLWAG
jgi:hypothetical protein